jgi:hypothetical protein
VAEGVHQVAGTSPLQLIAAAQNQLQRNLQESTRQFQSHAAAQETAIWEVRVHGLELQQAHVSFVVMQWFERPCTRIAAVLG